jgi:hypothetical protein
MEERASQGAAMTTHHRPSDPTLVVLAPAALRGRLIPLAGGDLLVGRGENADVRLEDPFVSRSHAIVRRLGSQVFVEDLGSTGGTTVNGRPSSGAALLAPGDHVRFADVETVFLADEAEPETGPAPVPGGAARFDLHDQQAGVISNVGRDQHVSYVANIRQERESFLREIAATKTKARYLIWSGLTVYTVGFALAGYAVLRTMARLGDMLGSSTPPAPDGFRDFFGTPVLGMPLGLLGFGLGFVGTVFLIFGIALHVVASARRRRLDRDLPHPYPTP